MSWKAKFSLSSLRTRLVLIFSLLITTVSAITFTSLYQVLKQENIRQNQTHAKDLLRPFQELYKTTRYSQSDDDYEEYDDNHYEYISPKKRTQIKLNEAFNKLPSDVISICLYTDRLKVLAESTLHPQFNQHFQLSESAIEFKREKNKAYISLKNFDGTVFFLVLDQKTTLASLQSYYYSFILIVLVIFLSSSLLSYYIVNKNLQSLFEIQQATEEIQNGHLDLRVKFQKKPAKEFRSLASSFNDMLDHIQSLITELGDLTNNVAHDMRTPITRIRSRGRISPAVRPC